MTNLNLTKLTKDQYLVKLIHHLNQPNSNDVVNVDELCHWQNNLVVTRVKKGQVINANQYLQTQLEKKNIITDEQLINEYRVVLKYQFDMHDYIAMERTISLIRHLNQLSDSYCDETSQLYFINPIDIVNHAINQLDIYSIQPSQPVNYTTLIHTITN